MDNRMRKRLRRLLLLLFIAALIFVGVLITRHFAPIFRSMQDAEAVRSWAENYGFIGRLIFIAGVAFQVLVAVVPAGPLEIAAGFAYGPVHGTLICTLGMVLGSAIAFSLVKIFGDRFVDFFFDNNRLENYDFLTNPRKLHGLTFIFFLIPGTPKDALTYLLGLTPMTLLNFLIISNLARIPATLVSAMAGDAIVSGDYIKVTLLFLATSLLSVLGYTAYNRYQYRHRNTFRRHRR